MAECVLPPVEGVLRPAGGPPRKWQRILQEQALPEGLLALAWSLAGVPQGLDSAKRKDLTLVLLVLLALEAQGSTCLPLDDPEPGLRLARSLGEAHLPLEVLDHPAAAGFVSEGDGQSPLVRLGARLSSRRLYQAEASLAEAVRIRTLGTRTGTPVAEAILADPVVLSTEQREAVAAANAGSLVLIAGGPGTGKTSIVIAILREALRRGLTPGDLALAAPTGKAAHRLAAALHQARQRIVHPEAADDGLLDPAAQPQTLHRLLGYLPSGDRFRHHAGNPLKARLVVVDEASMIDVVMMERLFEALHPEARLVLLGDADQLPSVEAGTAFRDLVAGLPALSARLTHSYRMQAMAGGGAAVLTAARKINGDLAGDLFDEPRPVVVRTSVEALVGEGVELLEPGDGTMRAFLDRWIEREIDGAEGYLSGIQRVWRLAGGGWAEGERESLATLFEGMDRVRLLCPTREAPHLRGSEGINAYLHARVQDRREQGMHKRLAFSLGEPVLMTRNDYARGIFNGDQGLMLMVAREGGDPRLEAVFPTREGFQAFAAGPLLGELELAYAITVHKSQGSEFDRVALVLPEGDSPLATREVLYTALTRARHGVTILGSREALARAASRTLQRFSRLGAMDLASS